MNKSKKLIVTLGALALTSAAFAQSTPTMEDNTAQLTAGVTAVAGMAVAIGGVYAGVLVWRKIAKYFQKAG